jgi:diaminohydroxyphosphoribosylaminopyrimidine deaminase/5-amino-6-(5-phosphoribosylamino)uracil reductase
MSTDEKYMKRCLELAGLASGNTAPNPMVGSVVVHDGRIIGEGYHQLYGRAHAEVNAVQRVRNKSLLRESTLYVNLEPCSHHGNTPPCSEMIVNEGIPRVVVGTGDTSSRVSGRGIDILKKGGCRVTTGVMEEASRELNRRFFTFHERQRPYVILKWAQTQDGFVDMQRKADDPIGPRWITNDVSRHLVHKWRTEEQAILIGSLTALKDNPLLNVREWHGKDPLRLLIDPGLQVDESYRMVRDELPLVVFTDQTADPARAEKLAGHQVEIIRLDFGKNVLRQIFGHLYERKILSVFVEGGSHTHRQFLQSGHWDEARIFVGNRLFHSGVEAPPFPVMDSWKSTGLKDTRLYVFRNV